MVSKHVMSIEKRLRVKLLNRNSHKLSLTEPGKLYFERCKGILMALPAFAVTLTPAIDIIRRRLPRSPVDEILRRRRQ